MKKIIYILMSILVYYSVLLGEGTTGAQFLKIGVGTRASALGEAYGALADDPTALYWNPAGLDQIDENTIYFEQNFWLLDMTHQFFGAAIPTKLGNLGVALYYSSSGDIPLVENFSIIGDYSAYDAAVSVGYGSHFFSVFSWGITAKFIYQKIEEETASSFAADLGIIYQPPQIEGMSFGLGVQNLGPEIKFIEEGDPLPHNYRISSSYSKSFFSLSAQIDKPLEADLSFSAGLEGLVMEILALRAGYNTTRSYSLGLGVYYWNLGFGYAFAPNENLDASHRLSLEFEF